MATIKAYTDLEQSKKLAEILPLESADICYVCGNTTLVSPTKYGDTSIEELYKKHIIPAWSLAALLSVLPKYELNNFGDSIQLDVKNEALATEGDESLLDLVVNMIIHLHELKIKYCDYDIQSYNI